MASPSRCAEWHMDYQAALREYGLELFDSALRLAVTNCMLSLADLPRDLKSCARRRLCLTALSDLLVLGTLHYKYELLRIVNTGDRESLELSPES
jgi:hypothetical protein